MADDDVTLISSDSKQFTVPREVAEESDAIRNILADTSDESPVPLMNVRSEILEKVIKYCQFTVEMKAKDGEKSSKSSDEVKAFNKEFLPTDNGQLFELILAANYLNIKSLLDITCQAVADQIRGKTPQQIRENFGIENDFTPEEEEEVRRENQWAFD